LNGKRTGMWLNDKFYRTDKNGEILVPFSPTQYNVQSVLVHEDFGDIALIQLMDE
jgi:hypothetical protein